MEEITEVHASCSSRPSWYTCPANDSRCVERRRRTINFTTKDAKSTKEKRREFDAILQF